MKKTRVSHFRQKKRGGGVLKCKFKGSEGALKFDENS
jgi:hypothetical protein